jgi:hypothetical protein
MEDGPDTGEKELSRILYVLKENGYKYEGVNKANYSNYMDATFTKPIQYTDIDGDYINDSHISVKIQFSNRFDYKNITMDEEGDYIYDTKKADNFIQSIYNKLLTTDERIGVANIAKAKNLPPEIERKIISHVGTIPKGGKFTKKNKRRKYMRKNHSRGSK